MLTTPGQLLVNSVLPEEYRDHTRTLGQDEVDALMQRVALEHPEKYREISHALVQLGRNAAFDEGSTITLDDLVPVVDKKPLLDLVRKQEAAIRKDRRLTDEQKDDAIATLYGEATKRITDETYKAAIGNNNPFAVQVKYRARGSKNALGAMLTSPGTYTDSNGKLVPIFISRSYAEGLAPHEYWAAGYGARLGVTCLTPDTKVVMADWTEREIGTLRPGDIVMGARADGTVYPVRVKRFFDNGIQPVYRWTFRCLASQAFVDVKATAEHKLLARTRRWGSGGKLDRLSQPGLVKLGSAKFGRRSDHNSYFAQVSAGGYFTGKHVDTALLVGLMTGDGCCSNKKWTDMSFSCADPLLLQDISGYLAGFNLRLRHTGTGYTYSFSRIEKIAHEWYYSEDGHKFNNRARYDVWRYIGGCHSWDKRLPYDIMSWDDESVVAYLAGLFATDGSFYRTKRGPLGFSLALNSLDIVEGVRRILSLRFGVWGTPVHDMQRSRVHHMYGFSVTHPSSFERLASLMRGIIPGVKRRKLETMFACKTAGRTPELGFRIQSKEYIGEQHVVDIEVDSPDHMFLLANGIISSNSTKLGTQKGGYLDKMMNATAIDQVVTTDDCGTTNGIPVSVDDQDNVGAVLQSPAGGFSAGTVITKQVLDQIREKGEDEIVIRSPITCGCKDGLCKKCVGIRENGRFPDIGYNVGVNAASALGERVTQGALNCIAEGTLVRMADGTAKPIEMVEPGDKVFGSDFRGNIFETTVVARYDQGVQPAFRTVFISEVGTVDVTTTTEHPILAMHNGDGAYHMCRIGHDPTDLTVLVVPYRGYLAGDVEHTEFVAEPFDFHSVESVGTKQMYDLEVECDEHIYLLANGIVCANTKHSGKNDALGSYIGFEGLKNMTTIPKAFDVKAAVAGRDGKVTAIEPAPQGGQYVVLDDDRDDRIYVPGNLEPSVKVGDVLEAGDAVSTGMVSPADVVQYKGVGEGRRYFMNRFRQVFKESGYGVNRRNVEVLSRALINNVQVENPDSEGSGLPGDIMRYSAWAAGYSPRSDATHGPVDKTALGRYLEQPVLHYTIGTRVTPSVLKSLKRHKVEDLTTHAYPPGVVPHMVSIVDAPAYSGDWMARLGTSYLKERLLEDVQRGGHSELHSTNPVPSMAKGIELGKDIATKGLY